VSFLAPPSSDDTLLWLQQTRDNFHDSPESLHLFLDRASHSSAREANRVADVDWLSCFARKDLAKPCGEVYCAAVGEEWCAETLGR
jgi:hypothetical protein